LKYLEERKRLHLYSLLVVHANIGSLKYRSRNKRKHYIEKIVYNIAA
jgi:hypothetical protein